MEVFQLCKIYRRRNAVLEAAVLTPRRCCVRYHQATKCTNSSLLFDESALVGVLTGTLEGILRERVNIWSSDIAGEEFVVFSRSGPQIRRHENSWTMRDVGIADLVDPEASS